VLVYSKSVSPSPQDVTKICIAARCEHYVFKDLSLGWHAIARATFQLVLDRLSISLPAGSRELVYGTETSILISPKATDRTETDGVDDGVPV
jgi:hypothetical protein